MALHGPLKASIATAWMLGARLTGTRPALTILYYHAVPDHFRDGFARQMDILAAESEVVFADYEGAVSGERPLVAITFDDAFDSVARNAVPILQARGLPATVFAPSGWLGQKAGWAMESLHDQAETVMPADMLRAIQSPLLRIGSHSIDHVQMAAVDPAEAARQAALSRSRLEELCGQPVDEFAFPYGSLNDTAVRAVAAAGYRKAYSVMPERIGTGHSAILRGRTAVEPSDSERLFRLKMNGAFCWMPLASRLKRALLGKS
jgi:peptidoglycan/xylan/chitin deacetylase (PgdA/CDA1 family)